jgi:beta-carotene 15,15'-dioxygenase
MVKYNSLPLEVHVLLLTVVLAGLYLLFPAWIDSMAPYFLLAGIIFPGIPHGAIDHYLEINKREEKYYLPLFVVKYLAVMALVVVLWLLQPLAGLGLFLLYSAWHFGETDLRRLGSFHPVSAFLSGLGLLMFILSSHSQEFGHYTSLFGVPYFKAIASTTYQLMAAISLAVLVAIGLTSVKEKGRYFCLIALVALGSFLPLLLAFGIYFILVHSVSGWSDIRTGLQISHTKLLLKALPFSMGAFILMGAFIVISNMDNTLLDKHISSFFIALAAISAPHILYMSKFYENRL